MTGRPPKILRSDLESNLKKEIGKFLKSKGCRYRVNQQNATTRTGWPDLEFFYEGFYGMIETKKHANSPWRPGQKENIEFFNDWSWARGVWIENWPDVKKELEALLK